MKHCGTQRLETNRLVLRRYEEEDAAAMYRNWASDKEVTKFLMWPRACPLAVRELHAVRAICRSLKAADNSVGVSASVELHAQIHGRAILRRAVLAKDVHAPALHNGHRGHHNHGQKMRQIADRLNHLFEFRTTHLV